MKVSLKKTPMSLCSIDCASEREVIVESKFNMNRRHRRSLDVLPSSLVLSPLWETCPPLDGPGVPTEGVEWASSMSLQDAGF